MKVFLDGPAFGLECEPCETLEEAREIVESAAASYPVVGYWVEDDEGNRVEDGFDVQLAEI